MNSPPKGRGNGAEVMIEVEGLTRYYGPVAALRDVSFRAYRGEILGFLGPNGAGKTTAMRILTGYMPPTEGRARVAGHDIVEDSMTARRAIGYLPETSPLYVDMTVEGYLSFMARLRHVADVEGAVDHVMDRVAIGDRSDQLISHLSKGYRQRVGLAQALVHDPEVIILDEPTIGLDPRQIHEVRDLIRELRGDHTLLMSTHILPEAQQVCDRVLIIDRGRIVAEDTPDRLTARLTGGEQIRVVVPANVSSPDVTAELGTVAGVEAIDEVGNGAYRVTARQGADPRPDLAAAVVGRGWPLLELTAAGMTLEDVFLKLTSEDANAGDDEGDDNYDDEVEPEEGEDE